MANEGKIQASDLLDEKALIIFRELQQITEDNIKAIEKLKETNQRLHKVRMKNSAEQIAVTQEIKNNLLQIDQLRKEMIDTELRALGAQQSAESKRKQVYNAEMKRIKDKLNAHEKVVNQEKKDIEEIKAARLKAIKEEEAADQKQYDKWLAWQNKKKAIDKKNRQEAAARRKATITAISTGFLALEQIYNRVSAALGQFVDKLKVLDNFSNLMRRLTGTASAAGETMEYLIDISRRFGLSLQVATERYSKFFAAAKQANLTLEDTRKIFTSVSKVSGILGLASHELSGVFLALEQMLSKGKVTTEELRRQLGERLPGAFGIMAKAVDELNPEMVITVANLDELLKKGEIISADVLPEFARQLEIAFNAMDVVKVETLAAAQSEFHTSITQLLYTLENGQGTISNFFRGFYDGLTSNIDAMIEYIKLADITREEAQKLSDLEARASAESSYNWWDLGDIADNPWAGATEELEKYKKELIDTYDYNQLNLVLQEDFVTLAYQMGLEQRKLMDEKSEGLIVDQLVLRAQEMTNEELQEEIRLLQLANDERRVEEKMVEGSIAWYDYKIKKLTDELTIKYALKNLNDEEVKNIIKQRNEFVKLRRELAILLGLQKPPTGRKTKVQKVKQIAPLGSLDTSATDVIERQMKNLKTELKGLTEMEWERADAIEAQLRFLERQLTIERGNTQQLFPGQTARPVDNKKLDKDAAAARAKAAARAEELRNARIEYGVALTNQLFEIGNALFARRIEQIQAEMDALDRYYDHRLLLAQGDDELQRELEEQRAIDMEALRKKELKERQKAARFEKAQAIASAIINTAVAITAMGKAGPIGIPLMALMVATGAAQVATILAQPIPEYKEGRKGGPAEVAIVGDGGRSEYIAGKDGSIIKTPDVPTLTYLNKGDSVLKDDRALQNMISQTLLKDHNIVFQQDARDIENAVVNGFKKAKVNNYIKMPKIKVDIDKAMWLNKNHQFGR